MALLNWEVEVKACRLLPIVMSRSRFSCVYEVKYCLMSVCCNRFLSGLSCWRVINEC